MIQFTISGQTDSVNQHKPENYFRFQYDNDFFSATDRYYTQGTLLTLIHPVLKPSPVFYILPRIKNDAHYYQVSLSQDVFTPRSIRYNGGAIYQGERPFCALLYLLHALTSLQPQGAQLLKFQLDLGLMGPLAKGEETQKGIHKALDNIEPLGWQNQLAPAVMVNYHVLWEKGIFYTPYFELFGAAKARIGTVYSDLSAGLNFRAGIGTGYFRNLGNDKAGKKFRINIISRNIVRAAGYNATLQGGLFSSGNKYVLPHEAVSRLVAEVSATLLVSFKRVALEYGRYYTTPEFKGGLDHGWGRAGIWYCF